MKLALLLAFPLAAWAQLTLVSVSSDGSTETQVTGSYNLGSVANTSTDTVRFRILNSGNAAATINTITISGEGFTIAAVNGTLPYPIAGGNFLEFSVVFGANAVPLPGTYSASLLITTSAGTSISVILIVTDVPGPTITPFSPCTLSGATITFGTIVNGTSHLCNILVENQGSQPLVISSISITGAFQASALPVTPLTLPAGGPGTTFAIQIAPGCGSGAEAGTLTLTSGSMTFQYSISAQGADPPLPAATLAADSASLASGQQHSLTMSLNSAAVCPASGQVQLVFTPAKNVPVTDDTAIVFLAGSGRSLPFTVAAGSTEVNINGTGAAMFQTGTTTGTITFNVTGYPLTGDPSISFTIPPTPASIETATASNQTVGQLNVMIVGYDNTYTAGPMSFTFFDDNGNQLAAISQDFTSNFTTYYTTEVPPNAGSSFLANISFPVQGNASIVSIVMVTLTNSAGQTQTGTLTFQ